LKSLSRLSPPPPPPPQATTTTATATTTPITTAAASTTTSSGLPLPPSSAMTFFSEVRGLDPLVRKEVRAQIEKKLPKLFKRVDIDLQEYRKRNMTAMARGILHEMRQRFAKSAKSSKSASTPLPATSAMSSRASKKKARSSGSAGGGASKKIAPEEHQRQNNEKMREWVVQQMSRKDRGPYWEDEEFCQVALKLTSTGTADDDEDLQRQLLSAQEKCQGGRHGMAAAEATAALSGKPIGAESKKTPLRKRGSRLKSGSSNTEQTAVSSSSSSSSRRKRRRRRKRSELDGNSRSESSSRSSSSSRGRRNVSHDDDEYDDYGVER